MSVQAGTRQAAEWLALSANQKHGLRRTKADEEWITKNALLNFPDRSVREIYRHTGINRRKISRIRNELIASGAIAPDSKVTVTRGGVTYQQNTRNIGGSKHSYAPVWELEVALRKWLSRTSADRASQIRVLDGIKQKTADGQRYLEQLLNGDILPAPKRKSDVIQACHNVLEQYRQAKRAAMVNTDKHPDDTHMPIETRHGDHTKQPKIIGASPTGKQPRYQLNPQDFECPRCGQEKIVGVNGSRRWCLNCMAEWSTAAEFLAEVNAVSPTREQLQYRFWRILAQLEEQGEQLDQISDWLDEMEQRLAFPTDTAAVALTKPHPSIQILEYA